MEESLATDVSLLGKHVWCRGAGKEGPPPPSLYIARCVHVYVRTYVQPCLSRSSSPCTARTVLGTI